VYVSRPVLASPAFFPTLPIPVLSSIFVAMARLSLLLSLLLASSAVAITHDPRHSEDHDDLMDSTHGEIDHMSMDAPPAPSATPVVMVPASSHGHSHSHAAPLLELNETDVLLTHAPDPLSYFDYDRQVGEGPRYSNVLIAHVVIMVLAFAFVLPTG
jgi:hypothetical protein